MTLKTIKCTFYLKRASFYTTISTEEPSLKSSTTPRTKDSIWVQDWVTVAMVFLWLTWYRGYPTTKRSTLLRGSRGSSATHISTHLKVPNKWFTSSKTMLLRSSKLLRQRLVQQPLAPPRPNSLSTTSKTRLLCSGTHLLMALLLMFKLRRPKARKASIISLRSMTRVRT